MGIYRQRMVIKRHESNAAFLEARMLLLYISLVSCCIFGSMGRATDEFQANFKAVVNLISNETFLPVPDRKFQCKNVPCQLEKLVNKLKDSFKNDQNMIVSLMEKNMEHIISTLKKARTKLEESPCPVRKEREELPQRALRIYKKFFQNLHEEC